ncbi:MAG: phosphoribosylanthranilate isomerase [Lachnospiraceae bacterium]|nr:phosphoribosylanthranilate isomerase [Lachnospiraceae bacterium]
MKIKICGITSVAETEYLNRNHVDFAGVVLFFPKSRRNTPPETAADILAALNDDIQKVAVVVSPSLEEVRQIEQLGFDYIQIHGTLSQELLESIHLPILKAFNVSDMEQYETYHHCPQVAGYVFDAQEPGSGKTFDWSFVKHIPRDEKLLLLAGGLHEGNVAEAIASVAPDGVDVSSGVEFTDRPGKDPAKIDAFVAKVRQEETS